MTIMTVIIAMYDRVTEKMIAEVMETHYKVSVQQFVLKHTKPGCIVLTDGSKDYLGLPCRRPTAVSRKKNKYIQKQTIGGNEVTMTTNNVENFRSMLKRGHYGQFHKISPKQLQRYFDEAVGKRSVRDKDTVKIMEEIAEGLSGRFLTYRERLNCQCWLLLCGLWM